MDPFQTWEKYVVLKDYEDDIIGFEEFFRYKTFHGMDGEDQERYLNMFWQAKYGMFCCQNMSQLWGKERCENSLIERWEKPRELHQMWVLSVLSSWLYMLK